jgi:misacylated tRNA(Ala) deacylase
MTALLHLDDAYLREMSATVVGIEGRGIVLDRTVFYPQGGGQPGDSGLLLTAAGEVPVTVTRYSQDRSIVLHMATDGAPLPGIGETVVGRIDWPQRFARMKMHTALHLLSVVLPYPVTGGSVGDGEGRVDFDMPDGGPERGEIESELRRFVVGDAAVGTRWITDEELLANPGLVKTMKVKPPMGTGRIRLVEIEGIDLQPCGGTHVARTGEIGQVGVTGIEKKGRQNRRVRIALAPSRR